MRLQGDPIEVGAAAAVFGAAAAQPFLLASSKSWFAHAEPAAGIVGIAHSLAASAAGASLPIMHLRHLNPLVGSALPAAQGQQPAWSMPRQLGGAAVAGTSPLRRTGISAFAFQVTVDPIPMTSGIVGRSTAAAALPGCTADTVVPDAPARTHGVRGGPSACWHG